MHSRSQASIAAGRAISVAEIERRTIRKLRFRILPLLFVLYIIAFVDRINIGFAALTMNKELAINNQQFGFLAGIFFCGYFLFEIPSNLLLYKIGARMWIVRILITWGIAATLRGLVHTVHQLYLMRFLLGLAEAGYSPGIVLYLSYWFPQREQARAIALFMTAIPVANIAGAPISGLILDHIHWRTMSSWRWLLILEGVPAIFFGAITYLLLPSGPGEAKFLSQDEKNWLTAELAREQETKTGEHSISALRALSNRRVWHLACIALTFQMGQYVVYFWMPQAIKSLSALYSNTVVGILVMIPYLTALVAIILVSRSSDRRLERRYHTAIPLIVGGIALVLLHTSASPFLSVAMWSMAAASLGALGPFWSLPNEFLAGASAAAGIALVNSIGSLGGFFGPYVFGAVAHGVGGIYRSLTILSTSWLVSAALTLLLPKAIHASARDDG